MRSISGSNIIISFNKNNKYREENKDEEIVKQLMKEELKRLEIKRQKR